VDRLTRKELKTDKFALELEHGVEYVADHKAQVTRYGTIAVAVVVLVLGIYFYRSYQQGAREDALREALRVQDAQVANGNMEGLLFFPTQAAKDAALQKALNDVATKYSGTDQGAVARYYLGTNAADKGDMATAEKCFKEVADHGPAAYASLAKLALAPIYKAQGKTAEGEKLLRDLMANPTLFVSKEEATIALGQYLGSSNPAEVRKLLEPLRTERSAVSRAALSVLGELPQK
jgi:predicted negative regulator of RcsB-dependent stress response